jgi:hypothetical protein
MRLLNVATWNIYNGLPYGFSLVSDLKRINKIIDNIETEDLEVLALQELNNLSVFIILFGERCSSSMFNVFIC